MEHIQRCAVSFSGGKDSVLALDRALRQGLSVDVLVTMYDEASQRVRFHGVPITLIQAQADALGIPLLCYPNTSCQHHGMSQNTLCNIRLLLACSEPSPDDTYKKEEIDEHSARVL